MSSLPLKSNIAKNNNNEEAKGDGREENVSVVPSVRRIRRTRDLKLLLPERQRYVGKVLVCGRNDVGQLGYWADRYELKLPTFVAKPINAVDIMAGGAHNLVLTHDGRVLTFGCNSARALGRDTSVDNSETDPQSVMITGKVIKISAGASHSACLLEDGRVFAWGSFCYTYRHMGLRLKEWNKVPTHVLPQHKCCDISSGAEHLVILTSRGNVYTIGCAGQGQLGRVSIRSISGVARRSKFDLLQPGLVLTKSKKPIEAIWATTHGTFLREYRTGLIWVFGLNNYKQLLVPDQEIVISPTMVSLENVKQIAGGQHHTLVLKNDGSVHAIGRCDYGRLGMGDLEENLTELRPITALQGINIVRISCGKASSFALNEDGQLYAWGNGLIHQLGTGRSEIVLEPVLIMNPVIDSKRFIRASTGNEHSLFLLKDINQPASVDEFLREENVTADTEEEACCSKTVANNSMTPMEF